MTPDSPSASPLASAKPAPQLSLEKPVYSGPTWEDDETAATGVLRALFTLLATGFLAYAQWHAPASWIGPIGQNWGKWVHISVALNFVIPLLIVWMFFGQGITYVTWLRDQKHNAWSYGFGWFQFPHDVPESDVPVRKLGRFSYLKLWHPLFWNAKQFGRRVWKRHFLIALGCWIVFLPFLIYFSRDPAIRAAYATYLPPVQNARDWLFLISTLILYMFCWEWFFRGFALFGMAQGFGATAAIALQSILFGLAHFGKPPIETGSAFVGGVVLGVLCWREKSFFPAFLIHALIHVSWAILVTI